MGPRVIHTKNTSAGTLHLINVLGVVSETVGMALLSHSHPLEMGDMAWKVVSQHRVCGSTKEPLEPDA